MSTLSEAFELAIAHHKGGRLQDAESIYRRILAAEPRHAPSLHMLGVLAMHGGRADLALGLLQNALALEPGTALFHNSLGETLRAMGQPAQAKECFRQAIELNADLAVAHYNLASAYQQEGDLARASLELREVLRLVPKLPEAHNELANILRQQGNLDEALAHFQQAIEYRPSFAEAHNDLGNLLQDRGQLEAAIASFERAVQLQPDMPAAHYNLGNALRAAGHLERAAESYRQAVRCRPDFALAFNNLGTTLRDLGDDERAVQALAEAARLDPSLAAAHYNLASLLQRQGALTAAEPWFRRAVALDPSHAAGHFNLGAVLQSLQRWDEARACYLEALRIEPDYVEAHHNLGVWSMIMGQHAEARECLDRTLTLDPACAEAHCNRGMLLLGEGNYDQGWPEHLWYLKCGAYYGGGFTQPAWDGSPLEGRTILIVCDHGLGDTLQFVRSLPWVSRRGAGRILLSAQKVLHPLLQESGFGELVDPDAATPEFDVHISSVMLPALYYAQEQAIDAHVPYLRARRELVERWRDKLVPISGFKVGICWHGSNSFPLNNLRSVPLAQFVSLAEVSGVSLISLQHGEGREQLAALAERFRVVDLGKDVDCRAGAFMDTAAIIENLDFVITSDTSTAHVAGGLAARTWLAVSFSPEWRWMRAGDTNPWYPTMRLFRQQSRGEWSGVFSRIARELEQIVK